MNMRQDCCEHLQNVLWNAVLYSLWTPHTTELNYLIDGGKAPMTCT
jgi:hypothetical protein